MQGDGDRSKQPALLALARALKESGVPYPRALVRAARPEEEEGLPRRGQESRDRVVCDHAVLGEA
jgi:hypothetical protein